MKQENNLLLTLKNNVEAKRKVNNKLHGVWKLSFDWKYCNSMQFIKQKLNYMHDNPCSGKWNLCSSPIEYIHSSAKYYLAGENGFIPLMMQKIWVSINSNCNQYL